LDSDLAAALVTDLVRSGISIEKGCTAVGFDVGDLDQQDEDQDKDKESKEETRSRRTSTFSDTGGSGGGGGGGLFETCFEQAITPPLSRKQVKITLAYSPSLKSGDKTTDGGGGDGSRSGRSGGSGSIKDNDGGGSRSSSSSTCVTSSRSKVLSVDCYLAAVGRVSNTQGLGLETLGLNQESMSSESVSSPEQKNLVDEFGGLKVVNGCSMETCVKGVYAAGDVVGRPYLASTGCRVSGVMSMSSLLLLLLLIFFFFF
jgi:hypothetical protein